MYPFVGVFCSFFIIPHESSYFVEQALCIKAKIRTYGEKFRKVYIHFRGLNVLEDIAIVTVKEVHYCCITYDTGKYVSIHILENSILNDCEYI